METSDQYLQPRFDPEALVQPVPDMTELRRIKSEQGYGHIPIDESVPRFNEPVVSIYDYGIAGQAYYSRPNAATGEAVQDVPAVPKLRKSFAEVLERINHALDNPELEAFFGGAVELYVEDALRPISLQKQLHDEVFPALIRKNHPEMSNEEIQNRVKEVIAVGSADPLKPSPHATGAAADVVLRYKQDTPGYVAGSLVPMGHEDGETSQRINPDYFEWQDATDEAAAQAQRNRRAYYAIMTGAAFGFETGLAVNPTEFWHWSLDDQLAALVKGREYAAYSIAPES